MIRKRYLITEYDLDIVQSCITDIKRQVSKIINICDDIEVNEALNKIGESVDKIKLLMSVGEGCS